MSQTTSTTAIVIRNNADDTLYIVEASNFETVAISDTYDQYGQKVEAGNAGDHLVILSEKAATIAAEEAEKEFAVNEIVAAFDNSTAYDAIVNHADTVEGTDYELYRDTCKAYNYWNGNNWRTISIQMDNAEPTHTQLSDEEAAPILAAYEAAEFPHEYQSGYKVSEQDGYTFTKSQFAGAFYSAEVE